MSEIKIPKEQLLPNLQTEVTKQLEAAAKGMGHELKVESVDWTAEGLTIFIKDEDET